MNIQEAKILLRSNSESYVNRVHAGWTIADSLEASFDDLLECLTYNGQIAEAAAIALYKRTGRVRLSEDLGTFVVNAEDWREYLRTQQLIS